MGHSKKLARRMGEKNNPPKNKKTPKKQRYDLEGNLGRLPINYINKNYTILYIYIYIYIYIYVCVVVGAVEYTECIFAVG